MTTNKKARPRTYARNRVFSRRGNEKIYETDGRFILKLVIVLILGTFWLKLASPIVIAGGIVVGGIPIGFIVGLILVRIFEPLQINRRIWYAVLTVTAVVSFFLPAGIVL